MNVKRDKVIKQTNKKNSRFIYFKIDLHQTLYKRKKNEKSQGRDILTFEIDI